MTLALISIMTYHFLAILKQQLGPRLVRIESSVESTFYTLVFIDIEPQILNTHLSLKDKETTEQEQKHSCLSGIYIPSTLGIFFFK